MARNQSYKGSIDLIGGLRPKNNGAFPLLDAHDVQVGEDGTRLDEALQNTVNQLSESINEISSDLRKTDPDIVDLHLSFNEVGYFDINRGAVKPTPTTSRNTGYVFIDGYKKVKGFSNGNDTMYYVAFFDENKNLLPEGNVVGGSKKYEADIPNEAKYLIASTYSMNNGEYCTVLSNDDSIQNKVTLLNEKTDGLSFIANASFSDNYEITFDKQGYINGNGEIMDSPDGKNTGIFKIPNECKSIIVISQIAEENCVLAFYDKDKTFLKNESIVTTSDNLRRLPQYVEIPNGACYAGASTYKDISYLKLIVKPETTPFSDIKEFVLDRNEFVLKGYIDTSGRGIIVVASSMMTKPVMVKGYNQIEYTLPNGSVAYSIAFFDSNFNFMVEESVAAEWTTTVRTISIPDNAWYMMAACSSEHVNSGEARVVIKNTNSLREQVRKLQDDTIFDFGFSIFQKWGVIGDSLSVGHTVTSNGETRNRNIYYSWPQYLARRIGNVCLNFGMSGVSSKTWMSHPYCYQRLIEENNKCQAYIVALGANDAADDSIAQVPIGSISDVDFDNMNNNADTVYGWYAKVINAVFTTAPEARVFLFTLPYPRNTKDSVKGINNMIREFASNNHFNHLYLVDLDRDYNEYFTVKNMVDEIGNTGWHLTSLGYLYASKINEKALSDVIKKNHADFQDVPFIPFGSNNALD